MKTNKKEWENTCLEIVTFQVDVITASDIIVTDGGNGFGGEWVPIDPYS